MPGHYLQGVFSNRCSSLARTILWSGVFAEGWAVYVTQVMMDAGYGADDPGLWLTHWKFYLRATTNAIIDVKIHTMDMTQDEAIALMVDGGFQEEAEARAKWNRARLSSTQLVTYFVGSIEFWDIELERRRQLALEAGGPSAVDAVSAPRVVGGLGDTPGFVYRKHLEEYQRDAVAAAALLKIGDRPAVNDIPPAEFAAWTSVARVILNLHETITRE